MPMYSFVCPKCGDKSELLRKVKDMNEPAKCWRCDTYMKRTITAGSFVIPGGHNDEYGPRGPRKSH